MRFMTPTPTLTADTLQQLAATLGETRAAAVVAVVDHPQGEELAGGGRVVPSGRRDCCEFALTVVDAWQGRGLGTILLREVVVLARALGYRRIEGSVLSINSKMLKVAERLKFTPHVEPGDPAVTIVSRLVGR
jgi:RimJ/RimL family protein N-acetyltransferase